MSQRIIKLIKNSNYSEREYQALLSLYNYRCLSMDQLYALHYSKSKLGTRDVAIGYLRRRFTQFKKDGLIEKLPKTDKDCPPLFSLTTDGIKVVRQYFGFGSDDPEDRIFTTNLTYAEIKIEPQFTFHQFYLNCFAINLNKLFDKVEDAAYVDERHMSKSKNIRPDGLLDIPAKTVNGISIPHTQFFIENDMGTETLGKVQQKFERYRAYLTSSAHDHNIRTVILFVCKDNKMPYEDCVNPQASSYKESPGVKKRINNIKQHVATAMMDCIKDNVEVFVGTQPKILAALKCLYLPEYFGLDKKQFVPNVSALLQSSNCKEWETKDVNKLLKFTNNTEYNYYAKSDKFQKSFTMLEYFGDPMSVMHKIEYHKKNALQFRQIFKRELLLLVIANKDDNIIALHNAFDLSQEKYNTVFFTTVQRLKELPFEKAIFQITTYGTARYNDSCTELIPDNNIIPNIKKQQK